jgi:hypothetical protein
VATGFLTEVLTLGRTILHSEERHGISSDDALGKKSAPKAAGVRFSWKYRARLVVKGLQVACNEYDKPLVMRKLGSSAYPFPFQGPSASIITFPLRCPRPHSGNSLKTRHGFFKFPHSSTCRTWAKVRLQDPMPMGSRPACDAPCGLITGPCPAVSPA